jgi:Isochorismatase family
MVGDKPGAAADSGVAPGFCRLRCCARVLRDVAGHDAARRGRGHSADRGRLDVGCAPATAMDALDSRSHPQVVRRACADRTPALHDNDLADLDARYADVSDPWVLRPDVAAMDTSHPNPEGAGEDPAALGARRRSRALHGLSLALPIVGFPPATAARRSVKVHDLRRM